MQARKYLLFVLLLVLTVLLEACGFHLRGHQGGGTLPFQSLFVQAPDSNAPFIVDLKRAIPLYGVKLVETPESAQLILHIVSENTSRQILSMSTAGRVNEFQLNYRVSLRAYDNKLLEWIPADEIVLQRYLSYDPTQILAKEMEETLLYQDMRKDAVQQVLRRLSLVKPPPTE